MQLTELKDTSMRSGFIAPLAAAICLLFGLADGRAAPTVSVKASAGTQYTTDMVDGFRTTGAEMAGMTVTVCNGSDCDVAVWAATPQLGSDSGAAAGSGWSLALDGDSFDINTAFILNTSRAITSFSMNGRPGQTVFDIVSDPEASPDSRLGRPFTFAGPSDTTLQTINVLYTDALAVKDIFYDDLFLVMQVDFGGAEFTGQLQFQTDTDNTGVITRYGSTPAPEPATLALAGIALLGLAAARRKSSRRA